MSDEQNPQKYCRHICGRCGSHVSHYRINCTEPEVLQSDKKMHPDCDAERRKND